MVGIAVDGARRRQIGCRAQEVSERFDIDTTVAQTVALYEKLRRERPDLKRERGHGRWGNTRRRWQPHLEQLVGVLKPPDRGGTKPLRRLFEEQEGK